MAIADGAATLASGIRPGRELGGRYRIVSHIADGTVASVYQARDLERNEIVALKVLDPLRGADAVGRARFEREFALLSRLSHPGIARSIAFERADGFDFIVLEHVEGMTLADRLSRGRIEHVEEVLAIAGTLTEALQACHAAGVIHRDLKPSNVMLHPTRGAVILDFGIAWFSAAANLTRTGAVIGSPQYMAPELFASSYVDARADVYAVGAMTFEMLTGRPMRLGSSVTELAASAAQASPAVSGLRPEVPVWLDAIVARAGAARADDRYATATELASALQSGSPGAPRGLKARTRCKNCKTPQVVDLPFCAGCGSPVSWGLRLGPYAIQLLTIPDEERCARWLEARHRGALAPSSSGLRARLRHVPVPIATGIAEETAEQLLAEAQDCGCTAEIVRARAVLGTRLKSSAATTNEALLAFAMHFMCVIVLGTIAGLIIDGWDEERRVFVYALPSALAFVGMIAAAVYTRRPVLRRPRARAHEDAGWHARASLVTDALRSLKTERARALASNAVLRAAPALGGVWARSLPADLKDSVWNELGAALGAARDVDAHSDYLKSRSRGRLSAEIEAARVHAEGGDENALRRLPELELEKKSLLDAAIAHDVAAKRALEHTHGISMLLQPFVHGVAPAPLVSGTRVRVAPATRVSVSLETSESQEPEEEDRRDKPLLRVASRHDKTAP